MINEGLNNTSFSLTASQRLVAKGAATDGKRPVLGCVHIRKGVIEASDGFGLVRKKIDYTGDEELLLDAGTVSKLKDQKRLGKVVFAIQEKEVKVLGEEAVTLVKQPGFFPETDKLIPQGEPVFRIALGKEVLKKLLSTLKMGEVTLMFSFYGITSPVKIEVLGDDTFAVIMPRSVRWDDLEGATDVLRRKNGEV